jgi:hypothetical protein
VIRATAATEVAGGRIPHATAALLAAVAVVLVAPAKASDATLRARLDAWSKTIGVDARAVALAAANRHPRRMTTDAVHFRADALRAQTAIRAQRASTPRGWKARRLALAAFTSYAHAGALWATSGRDRLAHKLAAATTAARAAAAAASKGNSLLLGATKLL